jgi:hypothetical protein
MTGGCFLISIGAGPTPHWAPASTPDKAMKRPAEINRCVFIAFLFHFAIRMTAFSERRDRQFLHKNCWDFHSVRLSRNQTLEPQRTQRIAEENEKERYHPVKERTLSSGTPFAPSLARMAQSA